MHPFKERERNLLPERETKTTSHLSWLTICLSIANIVVILGLIFMGVTFAYFMANGGFKQMEHEASITPTLNRTRRSPLTSSTSTFVEGRHDPTIFLRRFDAAPPINRQCQRRSLPMCAGQVPYNATVYPNFIGDNNVIEASRSLPYFNYIAKSFCNRRIKQLLCTFLEPPCVDGRAIPPCKKFCRIALEGCAEYVPATLQLSAAFDCRRYPDSVDPNVCVNLAMGKACSADEFHCPDSSCIPKHWQCDGVRDCIFAADEADCEGVACSSEEFQCDRKCVPLSWKCDGDRDCLDGSDEMNCKRRIGCAADRFKCADGHNCIPKRWVCDGKAECRDGSDEWHCQTRGCSGNDFKCSNGICIPKVWVCDGQDDCKDNSDERHCGTDHSTTTTPAPVLGAGLQALGSSNINSLLMRNHQQHGPVMGVPSGGSSYQNRRMGAARMSPATAPVRHSVYSLEPYVSSNNIYRWIFK